MNPDDFYPSVDVDFLCKQIEESGKVVNIINVGSTTAYILEGAKSITKRTITIRRIGDNTVDYNFASNVAFRLKFLDALMNWYINEKNWKEGGYFVPKEE